MRTNVEVDYRTFLKLTGAVPMKVVAQQNLIFADWDDRTSTNTYDYTRFIGECFSALVQLLNE
jgi:hypothetical protein